MIKMDQTINKMHKSTFLKLFKSTYMYLHQLAKIEIAFGGVELDCLAKYPTDVIDIMQEELNIDFSDHIYNMFFTLDSDLDLDTRAEKTWELISEVYELETK